MTRFLKQQMFIGIITIIFIISAPSLAHAQGGKAALGVFEDFQVAPGSVVEVPVSIRDVQNLYGLDLTLKFDPELLQVVDADSSTPGIQAAQGEFLDPGLLLFNIVDNKEGTLHFAMSQFNPSEPKSGEGIILVIQFRGVAAGESPLTVTNLQLASRDGIEIPSEGVNSKMTITATAPTQAATYPVAKSTGLVLVTFTPTLFPTVQVATATINAPQKVLDDNPAAAATAVTTGTNGSGYFLVDNWWIVIILLAAVIAAGIYFFVWKRN